MPWTGLVLSLIYLSCCFWLATYPPKLPHQTPQIGTKQEANGALQDQDSANQPNSGATPSVVVVPKPVSAIEGDRTAPNAEQGKSEGTEFWPLLFGMRVKITDGLLVLLTGALAVFTYQLRRSTDKLWEAGERQLAITKDAVVAAQRSADVADQSLKELNRAFVFLKGLDVKEGLTDPHTIDVWVTWENNGATQTKSLRSFLNCAVMKPEDVEGFSFPDMSSETPRAAMIGPKGTLSVHPIPIPKEQLQLTASGKARALIWGWVEYDDIFPGTKRHRTEFCSELKVTPSADGKSLNGMTLNHNEYNGAEEECGSRFDRAQKHRPRIGWADQMLDPVTVVATATVK